MKSETKPEQPPITTPDALEKIERLRATAQEMRQHAFAHIQHGKWLNSMEEGVGDKSIGFGQGVRATAVEILKTTDPKKTRLDITEYD